ncbi:DHA2 family efflux MFS transporter permease subunit [Ramlibacter algicola]|uniref:DHA2 family efflux MFS transporter permease subunit n=1 Tax=Ramlibacter algicola TaxID=2795217 RepID=A0A934Q1H1_9BURK|nr:DHA2 family efflux MFS transporter permease subunit [Ramlibacter algicola]MBK0392882.1 DHA2 family efflux MFS transporter permease subunit [Ramlibacter algicola]
MATAPGAAHAPLEGSARVWGTIALSAATFMNVLDTSIANVSLPAIAGDLGVSPNQGTWVITSFAVANAISVPLTGWLSQRFGQVKLFVGSVILFVIASWLCGLAPNMTTLIAFRALQGFVAGPMIPLSQTLLLASYPRALAGLAMAMWAMTTLVAPVMGPLLGGWITDNISWPWIFYINIPVGILAASASWALYHKRDSVPRKLPIDRVGLGLLVVWIAAMQMMLDLGKENDWFHSPLIVTLAVVAVVGFAFFLVWELTDEHPVVDLRLFTRRNFWTGTLSTSIAYGLFFGNVVLLPLWLQQFMGYTATDAGMIMAPVGLMAMVLSPVVGKTVAKVDPRRYVTFAFIVFALVLWMRSRFNTSADFSTIMVPTIIQGVAMAFFFIPLTTITLSGLSPDRIPAASGLTNFVRITAGAIGTSVSTTMWENRAALHHAQLAEAVNPANPAAQATFNGLAASGFSPEQAIAQVNRLADQQAFTMAATDLFWLSAALFLVLIPLVWMSRPTHGAAGADAAAGAH